MMRRITFSCAATVLLTALPLLVTAQQQQQPVRPSPRLSNEDLPSPGVTNLRVEPDVQPHRVPQPDLQIRVTLCQTCLFIHFFRNAAPNFGQIAQAYYGTRSAAVTLALHRVPEEWPDAQ